MPLPTGGVSSLGRDGAWTALEGGCHAGELAAVVGLLFDDEYEGVAVGLLSDSEASHINPTTTAMPISHLAPEPPPLGCAGT